MNTQVAFSLRGRNPDVLTCIANLSTSRCSRRTRRIDNGCAAQQLVARRGVKINPTPFFLRTEKVTLKK
ncbi:MAG: hypothetical protein ACYDBT_06055 [Desulfobulbaceae bacterium]